MKRILVIVLLAVVTAAVGAESWSGTFRFSSNAVSISSTSRDGQSYVLVSPGQHSNAGLYPMTTDDPGMPLLPSWVFTVVIPQGMRVAGVDVDAGDLLTLPGEYQLFPAQPPVPVSVRDLPAFVPGDAAVYGSDEAYPGRYAEVSPVGVKSGFRLVSVTVRPVQYRPRSGRLEVASRLDIRLRYEPDPTAPRERLTRAQLQTFGDAVRALVRNPEDVVRYAPDQRVTDWGNIDCLIITSAALEPDFAPLVRWHTKKGFRTEVRTVAWIDANYAGRDTPEKIRNCTRDFYTNQGTRWVLLGGDNAVVPCRQARAVVGSYVGDIPCDLYYGDIQWSWDGDNDNIFGESSHDTVDLYYDLYVGRASVDNSAQAQTFVNKVLTHEKSPPTDYLRRILLVDALLWSNHDQTQSNDSIMPFVPSGWTTVHMSDPVGTTAVRDSLNHGFQFAHMVGHGNEVGIYNGGTPFYGNSVIAGHTNGSRVGFINSIACYPGSFDYSDCLAENSHNCNTGGALAIAFNSRYGWGTPPACGPSEKFDIRFYDFFFNHDTMPLGITHALSKEAFRATSLGSQVYRWCYYELTLFADPLLMMYENVPTALNAAFTSPISTGSQSFTVTVTSGGSNVDKALVCLWKGTEVYDRNYTSNTGQVSFTINPTSGGYMYVTATRQNYLPDEDSCEVLAGATDVGPTRIVAPLGMLDSGTAVTPQAWVKNTGVLAATFPVTFRIGSGYTDTRTLTLAAGESSQVSFTSWTASPRGLLAERCYTAFTQDQNRANDTIAATVTVRVTDARVLRIVAPAGGYDSGTVVTPQAYVKNSGTTVASVVVTLRIGAAYTDSRSPAALNPGESTLVALNDWTATPCGVFATRCSVALAGDMVPANDAVNGVVSVGTVDMGVVRLLAPSGTIDSNQMIVPACSVANFSRTVQSCSVRMVIGSFYNRVQVAPALAPGSRVRVVYPGFSSWPRGTHTVTVYTNLAGDGNRSNDTARTSIDVRVLDVACTNLVEPYGTYDFGTVVTPSCTVVNHGTATATYRVRLRIGAAYNQTATVTNHTPTNPVAVVFPPWTAQPLGNSFVRCTTELANDCRGVNNRDTTTVMVRPAARHDVSVTHILTPRGQIDSGAPITPACSVRNYGEFAESYMVRMKIGSGYNQTVQVVGQAAHTSQCIWFPEWRAWPVGEVALSCSTELGIDSVPDNDKRQDFVHVMRAGPDVACVLVTAPTGVYGFRNTIAPSCTLYNYGNTVATYTVRMRIDTLYDSTATVTDHQPGTRVCAWFPVWTAQPAGGHAAVAFPELSGDVQTGNDSAVVAFAVMPPVVSPWTEMTPMRLEPSGRPIKDGAFLAYNAGNGLLYAAKGNKSNDFYSYNPVTDVWMTRNTVPSGDAGKLVGKGGCGVTDGNRYVYAAKGNNTREFYRYDISRDSWARMKDVPLGPRGKKVKAGADIVFTGDHLYMLKGYKNEFYRYVVASDTWEQLEDAPSLARPKWDAGSWLVFDAGASRIFAHRGKYHNLYTFDLGRQGWDTTPHLSGMPFYNSQGRMKKSKDGGAGALYSGAIYALKGGNTQEFWKYTIVRDSWAELETLPVFGATERAKKVKAGGDIASNGSGLLFAFKGNSTTELWRYEVIDGVLLGSSPRAGVMSGGSATPGGPQLTVAPSPLNRGFAAVRLGGQLADGPVMVEVYDATGRCVQRASLVPMASTVNLDLRSLAPGVYLVEVSGRGSRAVQKLVVQR